MDLLRRRILLRRQIRTRFRLQKITRRCLDLLCRRILLGVRGLSLLLRGVAGGAVASRRAAGATLRDTCGKPSAMVGRAARPRASRSPLVRRPHANFLRQPVTREVCQKFHGKSPSSERLYFTLVSPSSSSNYHRSTTSNLAGIIDLRVLYDQAGITFRSSRSHIPSDPYAMCMWPVCPSLFPPPSCAARLNAAARSQSASHP